MHTCCSVLDHLPSKPRKGGAKLTCLFDLELSPEEQARYSQIKSRPNYRNVDGHKLPRFVSKPRGLELQRFFINAVKDSTSGLTAYELQLHCHLKGFSPGKSSVNAHLLALVREGELRIAGKAKHGRHIYRLRED